MITAQELERVRTVHYPEAAGQFFIVTVCHARCTGEWPCLIIRMADALDAETARADAAYARLEQMATERLKVIYENSALRAEYEDAVARADAVEEQLAIQIEVNQAQAEVIEDLEARLYLTIPEGEEEDKADGAGAA
jgi:hypothetical protein